MIESIISGVLDLLVVIGLPALFVLFLLRGAFIGKPLPTTVVLPGYVLAVSADRVEIAVILLVSTTGSVVGQFIIYYLARSEGLSSIKSSPRVRISQHRFEQAEQWLETYGAIGVFVTNFVPYLRGLILIPAGAARYPILPLAFFTFTSTLIYHALVIAVGVGTVRAVF